MSDPEVLPFAVDQFGAVDHGLPLIYMRERRRELVLELQAAGPAVSMQKIRDIAAVQQTIKAIETVIAE
ncbi:hypothetical protein BH10PSE10_BH10PSE10_03890 [soil metagenome]